MGHDQPLSAHQPISSPCGKRLVYKTPGTVEIIACFPKEGNDSMMIKKHIGSMRQSSTCLSTRPGTKINFHILPFLAHGLNEGAGAINSPDASSLKRFF